MVTLPLWMLEAVLKDADWEEIPLQYKYAQVGTARLAGRAFEVWFKSDFRDYNCIHMDLEGYRVAWCIAAARYFDIIEQAVS